MSIFGAPSGKNVTGVNNIPAPASDDDKNVPPPDAATRIADFVRVSDFAGMRMMGMDGLCRVGGVEEEGQGHGKEVRGVKMGEEGEGSRVQVVAELGCSCRLARATT